MIVFLFNVYLAILFLLVKLRIVTFNLFWKVSPAIVFLLLLPFASYLIAEHIGVSGILAAVAAGMTISQSGVIRNAPLAMRLRANSVWAMLEFVFNGMVFIMLGLQLPGILETSILQAELDPTIQTWYLFADVATIYAALLVLRFTWLWVMKKASNRFMKKRPLQFGDYSTRELWVASFAGVRGAITLAGVLSIPLLLSDGTAFPARYQLVFIAAGVILLSLIVGVLALPLLLRGVQVADKSASKHEERMAIAMAAEVAIESVNKMEERLVADTEENLDPQVLKEVSSRVTGMLRRRIASKDDIENALAMENLERRFRLTALRAEHPSLSVELLSATQRVRQNRSGVDLEIVVGRPQVLRAFATPVCAYALRLYATPAPSGTSPPQKSSRARAMACGMMSRAKSSKPRPRSARRRCRWVRTKASRGSA